LDLSPNACPLCGRAMLAKGFSVNRHHLIPRSHGGKEQFLLHRMCHQKIHSLFTEKELSCSYSTWDALRSHPDIQTFIAWIQKKSIDHYDQNVRSSHKR
jgi:hypothetical protein